MSVPAFVRLPPGVLPRRIDLPAGPLAALEAAPPATTEQVGTALLLPGYTGSKEDFLAMLGPLAAAGHRSVAVDLRGQFESPGTEAEATYAVEALAGDVLAVIGELGDGPVHLVGHSFGGLVARRAVLTAPGLVRSLVLLSSGPAGILGKRRAWLSRLRSVLHTGGVPALWEAQRALRSGDPGLAALPPEIHAFLERRFLANHPVGMKVMGESLLNEPDAVAELLDTGVPILVCHGAEDDAWPPATQTEMAGRLRAQHVVLPGVGHSPGAEAPGATVAALTGFWAGLAAASGGGDVRPDGVPPPRGPG